MMNSNTQRLTYGAMLIAVFGVLLLLNRQTGGLFEEVFIYLFPVPMTAYSARYGLKSGIPVFLGMSMITLFCGSFTAIFYAVTAALLGLAFGACIYRKADMTRTLFLVMLLSAAFNILSTVVLASLFGYDLNAEIQEMQNLMAQAMAQAGVVMPENVFTYSYLKRIIIVSMVFMGIVQGFVIFEVTLLILKRLRFPVQRPRPIREYAPPKWTGYAGLAGFFLYLFTFGPEMPGSRLQSLGQVFGICGYLYMTCFGVIALFLIIRIFLADSKLLAGILSFLAMFLFPMPLCLLGFFYITGSLHQSLLLQLETREAGKPL